MAETKQIEVEVDGAVARFALREDFAPQTASALWETLTIEGPLRHAKLSGEACFCSVERGPLALLPAQPELPVASIYKGWLVASPGHGATELLISYGLAEYRWPTGRRYVTPLAELQGDGQALYEALARTHTEGEKTIVIRRV